MVDRKHSLHILGNLIAAVNITYCVPTWGQGERERERERERGGGEGGRGKETERVGEKEGGRNTDIKKNTSIKSTSYLPVASIRSGSSASLVPSLACETSFQL